MLLKENNISNNFLDSLILIYERESFIMAFNKISFMFLASVFPILLLLILKNKNYNIK